MSWNDEQLRLSECARLVLSSPELVFEELKARSKKLREHPFSSRSATKIEPVLVDRGERLINLGLAYYGADKEVLKALYKHGKERHSDPADQQYRLSLRLGCLANTTVQKVHWLYSWPSDLFGEGEVDHIISVADFAEAETLLCNPEISDELLEQLYKREGLFGRLAEDRLLSLVSCSRMNSRLNTNKDSNTDPDLGHYRIHNAILQLVETAPLNARWMMALYYLLETLDSTQVALPEKLEWLLSRWKTVEAQDYKGEVEQGLFVRSIPIVDEFRCLLAALYGGKLEEKELQLAAKSDDVALRAAYYAHANLTVKEIEMFSEREHGVFVFAAMYNNRVVYRRELRAAFEELLSRDWTQRFRKQVDLVRKRYRHIEEYLPDDASDDTSQDRSEEKTNLRLDRIDATIKALDRKIDSFGARLHQSSYFLVGAAILAAIAYYARK